MKVCHDDLHLEFFLVFEKIVKRKCEERTEIVIVDMSNKNENNF